MQCWKPTAANLIHQTGLLHKTTRFSVRAMSSAGSAGVEVATFALGKKLPGVVKTRVGYTGGRNPNPTYETVCDGDGHTEALRVWFDPNIITYTQLLEKFFEEHDPTYKSKPQYKSAIWYHNEEQKEAILSMIAHLESRYKRKIATTVDPEQPWGDAEDYHQDYMGKMVSSRWGW